MTCTLTTGFRFGAKALRTAERTASAITTVGEPEELPADGVRETFEQYLKRFDQRRRGEVG